MATSALDHLYQIDTPEALEECLNTFLTAVKSSFTLTKTKEEELLDRILASNSPVPAELLQRYAENLIKAVRAVPMHGEEAQRIAEQWLANVTRFAAYKTYCAAQDLRRVANEKGGDMEYIKAMFHAYNRWQAAEYNTAVARARTGKQWQQFNESDNVRLFPNIEWLPSRSATPREEHIPFYHRIWAKDDPFWIVNQPGTLWNCKCDWEETDEEPTSGNPTNRIVKPGLDENPATSGHIFTDTASYIRRPGEEGRATVESLSPVWEHINDYIKYLDDDNYYDVAYCWDNGGWKASHKDHNFNKSGGEYEQHAQDAGYTSGHSVILESERGGDFGQRFTEGSWDGFVFEVAGRETATENNVLRGLKHCASKRTTEIAVLDYPMGGFDKEVLENAIARFNGLKPLNDGQYLEFKKIICVQNKQIIYELDL